MARVTAKLNLEFPKKSEIANETTKKSVFQFVKEAIIQYCFMGISPVKGYRKFVKYKDADKYPGNKKPKTPANLYLTGEMLNAMERVNSKESAGKIIFGYPNSNDQLTKAIVHNFGENPNIPERHFIPSEGETFNQSIMNDVVDIFNQRIKNLLKK